MDGTGCPRMKYKLFCTDVEWLGEGGVARRGGSRYKNLEGGCTGA